MGKADIVTKAYMRKSNIFADAFNYLIYNGRKVINPEKLTEVDSTEIAIPFGATEERKEAKETTEMTEDPVQKYRDILKTAAVMQESETYYLLLGIENQTDIHYAMPVRNMIYDALQYGKQVTDTAASIISFRNIILKRSGTIMTVTETRLRTLHTWTIQQTLIFPMKLRRSMSAGTERN